MFKLIKTLRFEVRGVFFPLSIAGGGLGVIPPPPGGMAPKLAPPPGAGASPASMKRTVHQSQPQAPFPDMGAFASSSNVQQQNQQQKTTSEWGDFTAASG